ncbi:MAG: ornithine carbamoyltransferase, partial [Candidatus Micrarchaeaceae archaeon]
MNFLSSDDLTKDSINKIFSIADRLAAGREVESIKEHATVALLFEEPSTRTRISFEVAVAQLGGTAIYVDVHTSQMARGESLADTAKVISSYCDFIAVRINDHQKLIEIADNSTVPVINALTLLEHPTQALADVYTIRQHIKDLRKAKIAFVGDISQNTANSLMLTASKLGAQVNLVGPKGYQPNNRCYTKANSHSDVSIIHSIKEG